MLITIDASFLDLAGGIIATTNLEFQGKAMLCIQNKKILKLQNLPFLRKSCLGLEQHLEIRDLWW